jgi:hypothetical protein
MPIKEEEEKEEKEKKEEEKVVWNADTNISDGHATSIFWTQRVSLHRNTRKCSGVVVFMCTQTI